VPFFESPEGSQWPEDWSRDGRFILINDRNAGIVALPTKGDRKPIRVMLSDTGVIDYSQLSPDGHWMAYTSTESGQAEVRIASFPDFRNGKQVSASGGHAPRWRQDGKELFYMTGDGQLMLSVSRPAVRRLTPQHLKSCSRPGPSWERRAGSRMPWPPTVASSCSISLKMASRSSSD
jgi:Tol biopolymer transport system component